jgi:hypothetical protein
VGSTSKFPGKGTGALEKLGDKFPLLNTQNFPQSLGNTVKVLISFPASSIGNTNPAQANLQYNTLLIIHGVSQLHLRSKGTQSYFLKVVQLMGRNVNC